MYRRNFGVACFMNILYSFGLPYTAGICPACRCRLLFARQCWAPNVKQADCPTACIFFYRNDRGQTARDTEFTSVYTQSFAMSCWSTWSAYENCLWQATIKSCDKWKRARARRPPVCSRSLRRALPSHRVTVLRCALINESGISLWPSPAGRVTHVVASRQNAPCCLAE